MPYNHEWQSRIKAVERELRIALHGMDKLQKLAQRDPTVLEEDMRFRELGTVKDNLPATYFIRLFAEFEGALRELWSIHRDTEPGMHDLLQGIASRHRVPHTQLEKAHEIRDYRNNLVHERPKETETVSIEDGRKYLVDFLRFLPAHW